MTELTQTTFDYSVVTDEQQSALIYYAAEVQKAKNAMGDHIVGIGETLTSAQNELSSHKTGVFLQWVELECGFSKSTAYRCIAAYNVFGNLPNLGRIEVSALYVLSENSTPKKAINSAKKLADKGVNVTHAMAKKLIKDASEKGKPGGACETSSTPAPAPSAPAPEAAAGQDNDSPVPVNEEEPPPATTTEPPESSPSESGGVGSGSSPLKPKTKAPRNEMGKAVDQALGNLVRSLDAFGETVKQKNGTRHKACLDAIGEFQADWTAWKEGR